MSHDREGTPTLTGPLKLPLIFVQKIADFRPGKAKPCLDIVDLQPDQPQADFFFGGMQTALQCSSAMSMQNRGTRTEKIQS